MFLESDILVLTSVREGFGNVLVEALNCGLGLVCTDCGDGVSEVLDFGRYGNIVHSREPSEVANAILSVSERLPSSDFQKKGAERFWPDQICGEFLSALFGSDKL